MKSPHGYLALLSVTIFFIAATNAQATDVSGSWQGRWYSEGTGHEGPLRATISKIDDEHYQVNFRGRFFKLVPFRYSVVLTAKDEGGVVTLSGQSQLGRLVGGTYHYTGTVTDSEFKLGYTSCKHYGTFEMTRCGCK